MVCLGFSLSFLQQFWVSIEDDFRLPVPCFVRVLRVLREIKDSICEIAGGREKAAAEELLDIDFIKHQLESNVFSLEDCKRLFISVVDIIRRIQTPKRDADLNEKWKRLSGDMIVHGVDQPKAFSSALRFVFERANILRIDAANTRYVF